MSIAAPVQSAFVERISHLVDKVRYHSVHRPEEREAIFRLRYDAYRREGMIAANFSRQFSDHYDDMENARLFGVYFDDKLVSSIRISVISAQHPMSPSAEIFPEFIQPWIDAGQTVIDPTRFVVDHAAARLYPELAYITIRLAPLACEYFHADQLLAAVRAEHQAFYRRVSGHSTICPPRAWPALAKPLALMKVDVNGIRGSLYDRYPFFRSTLAERQALFGRRPQMAVAERSASSDRREAVLET